ncbi:hypothetical protein Tco_0747703 [Tanacetum coccineum]|uniref:Uncharacterized protein n=1 Tax=Tanacetum coccineum TaxID=301880 RepID=A0ABQ4YWC4_9ASTR
MESIKRVELESRHLLHNGDLFQGVDKFSGVDLPFVPYLDCFLEKFGGGFKQAIDEQDEKKKRSGEDDEE